MTRSRSLAALALGSLLLLATSGCKQGIGQRCEQASDCASGFCSGTDVTRPGMCTNGTSTPMPVVDASSPSDTGVSDGTAERGDVADALAAETGDVGSDSHPEAGEAGADTGTEAGTDGVPTEAGPETSAADGATDVVGDGAGAETAASGG